MNDFSFRSCFRINYVKKFIKIKDKTFNNIKQQKKCKCINLDSVNIAKQTLIKYQKVIKIVSELYQSNKTVEQVYVLTV